MMKPGSNLYTVECLKSVVKKDISRISKTNRDAIKKAIELKLTHDPITFGKPLRYSLSGHRIFRVGNYRVVYRIDISRYAVIIVGIKHRQDVYQGVYE